MMRVSLIGFNGLLLITLISLIASLFLPQNFPPYLIIHIIGIAFIIYKAENKKKYLKYIILISISVFSDFNFKNK